MEEDHIHSTPISHCPWQQLLFLFALSLSRYASHISHLALKRWCLYIAGWCHQLQLFFQQRWMVKVNVRLLHINGNKPNNHPLCHSCGATVLMLLQHNLASCSSSKLTIPRASVAKFTGTRQTFQSPESPKHTLAYTKGSLQPDGLSHLI